MAVDRGTKIVDKGTRMVERTGEVGIEVEVGEEEVEVGIERTGAKYCRDSFGVHIRIQPKRTMSSACMSVGCQSSRLK